MYCTVHAVASRHDEKAVPSRPIRRQQTAFAGYTKLGWDELIVTSRPTRSFAASSRRRLSFFFLFSFSFFFFLFSLPLSSYPVMKKWRATACR